MTLTIPRVLKSPNRLWGRHWRAKYRETKAWELELAAALGTARQAWNLIEATETRRDPLGRWRIHTMRRMERRRVVVIRRVARVQDLIRDDENLAFVVKPLNDALVRLGLLVDDSRAWLDQDVIQQLGDRGTEITIARL